MFELLSGRTLGNANDDLTDADPEHRELIKQKKRERKSTKSQNTPRDAMDIDTNTAPKVGARKTVEAVHVDAGNPSYGDSVVSDGDGLTSDGDGLSGTAHASGNATTGSEGPDEGDSVAGFGETRCMFRHSISFQRAYKRFQASSPLLSIPSTPPRPQESLDFFMDEGDSADIFGPPRKQAGNRRQRNFVIGKYPSI